MIRPMTSRQLNPTATNMKVRDMMARARKVVRSFGHVMDSWATGTFDLTQIKKPGAGRAARRRHFLGRTTFRMARVSSSRVAGLATYPSMPAARKDSLSPSMA